MVAKLKWLTALGRSLIVLLEEFQRRGVTLVSGRNQLYRFPGSRPTLVTVVG
jgi:hypothetical protein